MEPRSLISPSAGDLRAPLEGITIVETAFYYASPFASALLAELGARVIKVESLIGDPYRRLSWLGNKGADPVRNLGHNSMVRAMQGKESIAINLKDERGQEILHRLIAQADVFTHNFRPGVPASLSVDEETLRQINPGLVYQYASSYGSEGPYARQPAIDPVIGAFSGLTAYQAGEGNPPLGESGADPFAAAGHAVALILGLLARHRTGQGQYVESAMILSNLFANCEDALSYDGKTQRPVFDRMQFGTAATHRLYKTAPAARDGSRWIFLAAVDDDRFARYCQVAGRQDLLHDPKFATAPARQQNRSELEGVLEEVFQTRTAEEWETTLIAAGVGCVRADAMSTFAFLFEDPQAKAVGLMTESYHPSFGGRYWRHAPLIHFSETSGQARPFCELGEHTRSILTELGYNETEIAQLKDADVVSWPSEIALELLG